MGNLSWSGPAPGRRGPSYGEWACNLCKLVVEKEPGLRLENVSALGLQQGGWESDLFKSVALNCRDTGPVGMGTAGE